MRRVLNDPSLIDLIHPIVWSRAGKDVWQQAPECIGIGVVGFS